MWYYILVLIGSFLVDLVPFIGPPAWTVMMALQMYYDLNIWLVLLIGVTGSTIGRYMLSLYMPWLSERVIRKEKNEDLQYIGGKLAANNWRIHLFVLAYTLVPLPSTPLFTASGIAKIKPTHIIPAFFVGKFTSDMAMVLTGNYIADNSASLISGYMNWKNIAGTVAGILLFALFLFIDWRTLLEHKKLRLNFNIWKRTSH